MKRATPLALIVAALTLAPLAWAPRPCPAGEGPPPGAAYAVIAYSRATGRYGYCSAHAGALAEAEACALRQCAAADARVVTWSRNAWCALAVGGNRAYGYGWGTSAQEARQRALRECRRFAADARMVVCAHAALGREQPARIVIRLPVSDAVVLVDGAGPGRWLQVGPAIRVYETASLTPGEERDVAISVRSHASEAGVAASLTVRVRAGRTEDVDMAP